MQPPYPASDPGRPSQSLPEAEANYPKPVLGFTFGLSRWQLYQGFLERAPSLQERNDWAAFLLQTGDVKGAVEFFIKSPEYAQKNKNEQGAIRDLYEGLLGRAPSNEELRNWEQQIARR